MANSRQAAATSASTGSPRGLPARCSSAAAAPLRPTASHCRASRGWPTTLLTTRASIATLSPSSGDTRDASARRRAANTAAWPSRYEPAEPRQAGSQAVRGGVVAGLSSQASGRQTAPITTCASTSSRRLPRPVLMA